MFRPIGVTGVRTRLGRRVFPVAAALIWNSHSISSTADCLFVFVVASRLTSQADVYLPVSQK